MTIACGDSTTGNTPGMSQLKVLLTDAPGDVLEAWVSIDEIYLQGGGRTVLMDEPVSANLVSLADETLTLLQGVEIPAGSYSELRFVISGACILVEGATENTVYKTSPAYDCPAAGGATGNLVAPSFDASGLKVHFGEPLVLAEGETTLLVDFDVAQSFGQEGGQSGNWVMHPVITGEKLTAP
jgi:hypothetical protein